MTHKDFKPILAHIFWPVERNLGTVTPLIRDIMNCFVDLVYLDYPKENIEVLAVSNF